MTTETVVELKDDHMQNEEQQQQFRVETIHENGNEDVEATGDAKPQTAEMPSSPMSPEPTSPTSPSSSKKEKRSPDGKGISRFIPPWLRKQKSQSQVDPKVEGHRNPTQEIREEVAMATDVKPEDVMETEKEFQEQTEPQTQDVKIDEQGEKKSTSSADTQPAKEDRLENEKEVTIEEVEKKEQESIEESKKDIKEEKIKTEKISQKPPKKLKTVLCKVILVDRTEYNCEIEKRAKGHVLFDKICEHVNLLEKDYFGLTFQDNADQKNWVDPAKGIKRQIRSLPWLFGFNVKFYPPDPSQLTEDITRYFLCLQLRQDIASGRLPCSFVTHALLGSYTLQAELGDFDPEEHMTDYISEFQFAPNQTKELEEKVVDLHKSHRGLTPAQSDMQFVDNAKKLSMYGVDLHHAKDSEAVDIMLGISASGLLIYKDRLRINRFAWPKILKISYKRNNFYIKVRPGEQEQFESTIGFKLPNHRAAKRLWKVCVEHHTFFRLKSPDKTPKAKFLTLGSKFRYSGRTQAETQQASTMIDRPAPYFERTSSKRISRSLDGAPMGSITDQSLLNEVAASGNAVDGGIPGVNASEDATSTETSHLQAKSSHEIHNVVDDKVGFVAEEALVNESEKNKFNGDLQNHEDSGHTVKLNVLDKKDSSSLSSSSSSESEEESAEYRPDTRIADGVIEEELEEQVENDEDRYPADTASPISVVDGGSIAVMSMHVPNIVDRLSHEATVTTCIAEEAVLPEAVSLQMGEEADHSKVNGEASPFDMDVTPQIIFCSEPPVVKTEMVTISDASQKTEICTKEVPIVQTETKTITYEASQVDGGGDSSPGVLMSAQTITSESLSTTTTTHITKTVKGGVSETRIEKRIVITGDADIDHDEALAQAIKEAKELHPDMSVTRVVVHKETELTEEEEEEE